MPLTEGELRAIVRIQNFFRAYRARKQSAVMALDSKRGLYGK